MQRKYFVKLLVVLILLPAPISFVRGQGAYQPLEPTIKADPLNIDPRADFPVFFKQVYTGLFRLAGIFAVIMIIYGGILYVFGGFGGKTEVNITKARDVFTHLAIGAAIILLAWLALNTINPDLVNFKTFNIPPVWEK